MIDRTFRLATVDSGVRLFLTAFLITITLGYAAGLYFVAHTTDMTPGGAVEEFRGNEELPVSQIDEIKFAKDTLEMMNIIHTHVTSFALIYLAVGGIFLFSRFRRTLKIALAVEPFAATVLLFGGMAGLRYFDSAVADVFAWLMMVTGTITALCFVSMVGLSLFDLWAPERQWEDRR